MEPISVSIAKIFELLIKLVESRNKRRKKIFSEILQPAFEQLQQINLFYRKLFLDSIRALPPDSDYADWEVREVKRKLIEGREEGSVIRDQLRNNTTDLLKSVPGEKEKRFLVTVMFYFLEEPSSLDNNVQCDRMIERIETVGGITAVQTPASYVSAYIERKNTAAELRTVFEGVLKGLETKFRNVNRAFMSVKLDVVSKT